MNKSLFKKLLAPIIFLALIGSIYLIWQLFNLPTDEQLIVIIEQYFNRYGLIIVFLSSLLEGVCFLGWYYPGSIIIFLSVIFAGKNIPLAMLVVLLVTLGLFSAYVINFFIGKYGWHKLLLFFGLRKEVERMQVKLSRHGWRTLFATYWDPNLASLTSTAAGILQLPFKKFFLYSFLAATLWDIFWGAVTFFLGKKVLTLFGLWFVVAIFIIWCVILIFPKKTITIA